MQRQTIIIIGGALLLVISFVLFVLLRGIGTSYEEGLTILPTIAPPAQTREAKKIRRVLIQRDDSEGCMEVTNEGVVRTFDTCGEELTTVSRPTDPKFILRLLQVLSQIDTTKYRVRPSGPSLRLVIETDNGTEIVYVPVTEEQGSISDIIESIEEDIPEPTATPVATPLPSPTLPGTTSIPTPSPSPTLIPGITPTPTSSVSIPPFTCDFDYGQGPRRPYNVSSILCTTEPSPVP